MRVIKAIFIISIKQFMERRFEALGYLAGGIMLLAIALVSVTLVFGQVNSLNGWSKEELFLFVGVFVAVRAVFGFLFSANLLAIENLVNKGELDFLLIKPFSSQVLVSLRRLNFSEIGNVIPAGVIIYYALSKLGWSFNPVGLVVFLICMVSGVACLYSMLFMISTLVMFAGRFRSMPDIILLFMAPLALPVSVYGRSFALILTYILPLAFVVSVPMQTAIRGVNIGLVVYGILAAVVLLWLSHFVWGKALNQYASSN